MQLKIVIQSSFVDPTTQCPEGREHTLTLNFPAHLYWPFKQGLRSFVREGKLGTVEGLTVTTPHRMSWDPVSKIQRWFGRWLQEADSP